MTEITTFDQVERQRRESTCEDIDHDQIDATGEPLCHCQTREVNLTVDHRRDADIQHRHGTVALRKAKVLRLSWEAYEQGALLSYEDLASILEPAPSDEKELTAKRDLLSHQPERLTRARS